MNNYKNTAVMRGAILRSDDPNQVTISTASLDEGIPAEEFESYADMMVQASFSRSVGTQRGGYISKILTNSMQFVKLNDDRNSDCKTKYTKRTYISDPKKYLYRNINQSNKVIMITPDNMDDFKNKYVDLYTPLYCAMEDSICAKCGGDMYYRAGIKNIGLLTNRIGTVLLNSSLKATTLVSPIVLRKAIGH